jgi:hypothetical protein
MPDTDYIKGSWSKTPPATVSGTDEVTYTYKYKKSQNPVITDQKVNYTVEHYKDGTKVETETLTGYEGATVTASPKTFDGYCLNTQTSSVSATLYTSGSIVLKLYYDTDANGDGIPDKYQKKVTFKVASGKWNDGTSADKTLYLTLEKAGMWDTNGSASLTVPAVGSMPNSGYKAGKWNPSLSATVSGKDDAIYTYTYAKSDDVVAPDNTADYTVEHYKANPNGSYELISTEKLSAIIGATVTANTKTFAGFCLNTQSSTASATLVNGTVLKLYYDTDENSDKVPDK